jgi:anthranilate synthase component 1
MADTRETCRETALAQLAQGQPALVWTRLIADTETPVGAALKLFEPGRGDFLLESVEGGEVRGRYSLVGLDPDLVFRASGAACEINRHWGTDRDTFASLAGNSRARWPAWSAISATRPSASSKSCRARPKARLPCPTCCSCARP